MGKRRSCSRKRETATNNPANAKQPRLSDSSELPEPPQEDGVPSALVHDFCAHWNFQFSRDQRKHLPEEHPSNPRSSLSSNPPSNSKIGHQFSQTPSIKRRGPSSNGSSMESTRADENPDQHDSGISSASSLSSREATKSPETPRANSFKAPALPTRETRSRKSESEKHSGGIADLQKLMNTELKIDDKDLRERLWSRASTPSIMGPLHAQGGEHDDDRDLEPIEEDMEGVMEGIDELNLDNTRPREEIVDRDQKVGPEPQKDGVPIVKKEDQPFQRYINYQHIRLSEFPKTPEGLNRLPFIGTPENKEPNTFLAYTPQRWYDPKIEERKEKKRIKEEKTNIKNEEKIIANEEPIEKTETRVNESGETVRVYMVNERHLEWEDKKPDPTYRDDLDERIWSPPESVEGPIMSFNEDQETTEDTFYKLVHNVYYRAIWQQFKSHIPLEMALQHLMRSKYDIAAALDSIDSCLLTLPQKPKDLCLAQAKRMYAWLASKGPPNIGEERKTKRRKKLLKATQNLHLGEIQNLRYQFRRFYKHQVEFGIPCNCSSEICRVTPFEPRYGCWNCTSKMRATTVKDPSLLCLICQTYQQLTGTTRPAEEVFFTSDESELLNFWIKCEKDSKKTFTRVLIEILFRVVTKRRREAKDLNDEERLMLAGTNLESLSWEEKNKLLEPFVLPLFTSCNCGKPKGFQKKFKELEVNSTVRTLFREAILRGNSIEGAAKVLKLENPNLPNLKKSIVGLEKKVNTEKMRKDNAKWNACENLRKKKEELKHREFFARSSLPVIGEFVKQFLHKFPKDTTIWNNSDFVYPEDIGVTPATNLVPIIPVPKNEQRDFGRPPNKAKRQSALKRNIREEGDDEVGEVMPTQRSTREERAKNRRWS